MPVHTTKYVDDSVQNGKRSDECMFAQEFMAGAGKQGVLLVSMGTVVELGAHFQLGNQHLITVINA